ncbi:MAG: signal peptide peptidase SppA [Candidatus Syntrophosphaera sp.]|nr:signal peptide peptidase SppA [Candidatus Syntrophosphaera sp.]
MKTHSAILIGCGAIIVILAAAFAVGYFIGFSPRVEKVSPGTWLLLDPGTSVPDYNEVSGSGFLGFAPLSAEEICRKIRHAASDTKIKGIVIRPGLAQISYANLNEINAALQEFQAAGKPVVAHGEIFTQRSYLLGAMADKVHMDPTRSGGLILEGVAANILFYRDALKKLGIKMHVMQAGEYKGAGEPYTQTSLNPGTEENLRQALKGRYEQLQADIAQNRGLDPALVSDIFENRPDIFINAEHARIYGLIDELSSWDELREEYGITDSKTVSIKNYSDSFASSLSSNKIAVVNLSGNITPSSGWGPETFISAAKVDKVMDAIEEDGSVKAVVLRVNSPGGSALESELIYQRIKRLDIPVVVSMGGVAASGGYYISCSGDHIIADPHTITGSIGVIMALPEAEELGNKLGIESQTLSYGKFAAYGSIFEPYGEEFLSSLERNSENVYAEFTQRVMDARGISPEEISAVAEGRVFIASDAKASNLIDEIGGLDTAVAKAAELAGIDKYGVKQYPEKMNVWELFRSEGFFQMASELLARRDFSLEQRILDYLERTLATRQWLYFCPVNFD